MQEKSVKSFTARLDAIQASWACSDSDFAQRIGISRQLLYLMRSGKQQPSKKTMRLLNAVESGISAGLIQPLEKQPSPMSQHWTVAERPPPYGYDLAEALRQLRVAIAGVEAILGRTTGKKDG